MEIVDLFCPRAKTEDEVSLFLWIFIYACFELKKRAVTVKQRDFLR